MYLRGKMYMEVVGRRKKSPGNNVNIVLLYEVLSNKTKRIIYLSSMPNEIIKWKAMKQKS